MLYLHDKGKKIVQKKNLPGAINSGFPEGNPTLFLLETGESKLLELETEPDGSISQGETLLCLLVSISSHLTCDNNPERAIRYVLKKRAIRSTIVILYKIIN